MLSYDARLVPRKVLAPGAIELQERICELAAMMFEMAEHGRARSRMKLMGALGGRRLGVDSKGLAAGCCILELGASSKRVRGGKLSSTHCVHAQRLDSALFSESPPQKKKIRLKDCK